MTTRELQEIHHVVTEAFAAGVAAAVRELRPEDDYISLRQAYKIYGKTRVTRWIDSQRLSEQRIGRNRNSKAVISKADLRILAAENSIESWITNMCRTARGEKIVKPRGRRVKSGYAVPDNRLL